MGKNTAITSGRKILIFSDTHLTKRFDSKKYSVLKKLVEGSDKVIVNGDLWDSWFCTFDEFLNSKWNGLFPYLLERDAIYIFGNHDPADKCDDRVKMFSLESGNNFEIKSNDVLYHIEHGHKILDPRDSRFMKLYSDVINFSEQHNLIIFFRFLSFMEGVGFKILGKNAICNSSFARKRNDILKQYCKKGWLICGDTHCPEIDYNKKFANSGCIIRDHMSYLVMHDDKIQLF